MPFSFLMLSMVAAGALAAALAVIPLIVHLLHRQKVTPVAWGAMQFLLESPLRVRRRRRIDHWVLMLLRMAILMLLVFLLCRPVWKTSSMATSTPVDVVVVIDHSMTMGMRQGVGAGGAGGGGGGGGRTLYEQGIDVAERISKMLPPSGTMSIVLAEHSPRIMTPTPLKMGLTERADDGTPRGEWAKQLQVLRALKPGMTKGDIPAGIEAAREMLAHGYNPRKIIFVVSDDQRTNWDPGDEKAWTTAVGHAELSPDRPSAIPVFSMPVKPPGAADLANVTVRSVLVLPEFLGVHRPAQIVATVANSGAKDLTNVPIVLEVDGKQVMSRPLASLAMGESTSVRFDYYFPEAGSHWVRVRADVVDALDADNAATAAVNVKSRLPVLVVDGQLTGGGGEAGGLNGFPQAVFLQAAMQPVDPTVDPVTLIDPKVISVGELATLKGVRVEDFAIVVLNDVPRLTREWVDKLAAHAQAGNGVWIILGPRTEASFINDVLAKSTLLPMTTKGIAQAPAPKPGEAQATWVTIDVKEPANRAVSLLTNAGQAEHSALADVTLRSWWTVVPVVPEMRTVLATTTGDPLVLEMEMGKVGGRAVVWTSCTGDVGWSNLRLVQSFVPLVNETLFNLASGQDAGQPRQVEAGRPLTWTGGSTSAATSAGGNQVIESVQLLCPDGSTHPLQPELKGDHYYVEERETSMPGLYEMRFSAPARAGATAPPVAYFSVNIDGDELDPAVLAPDDFTWYRDHGYVSGIITPSSGPASIAALAKAMEATHGGRDLWQWLGVLLLGLLVVEVLVTYMLVRQQAGKTLEEEGLSTVMPKGTVQEGAP